MLILDESWPTDLQFNPRYNRYSLEAPMVAHAGDIYHTHCEWQNNTSKNLTFPDVMCSGIAFYFPARGHISCTEGKWPTK